MATYKIFTSKSYEFLINAANELEAKNKFIVKVLDDFINDSNLNYGEVVDIVEQSKNVLVEQKS
jgi:hypothetical protein